MLCFYAPHALTEKPRPPTAGALSFVLPQFLAVSFQPGAPHHRLQTVHLHNSCATQQFFNLFSYWHVFFYHAEPGQALQDVRSEPFRARLFQQLPPWFRFSDPRVDPKHQLHLCPGTRYLVCLCDIHVSGQQHRLHHYWRSCRQAHYRSLTGTDHEVRHVLRDLPKQRGH